MSVDARTSALKNVWWIDRDKLAIVKVLILVLLLAVLMYLLLR